MAAASDIEWTEATWPVVQGCDYESPGCAHCYAVPLLWRLAHNPNAAIAAPLQGLVERRGDDLVWTGKVALRRDRLGWPAFFAASTLACLPALGILLYLMRSAEAQQPRPVAAQPRPPVGKARR